MVNDGHNIYATANGKITKLTDETLTLTIDPFASQNSNILIYFNSITATLDFSQGLKKITVYDLSAKTIKSYSERRNSIDISDLCKGNYILKGETETGEPFKTKFIKD